MNLDLGRIKAAQIRRDKLARDTREWEDRGGVVQVLPVGTSSWQPKNVAEINTRECALRRYPKRD